MSRIQQNSNVDISNWEDYLPLLHLWQEFETLIWQWKIRHCAALQGFSKQDEHRPRRFEGTQGAKAASTTDAAPAVGDCSRVSSVRTRLLSPTRKWGISLKILLATAPGSAALHNYDCVCQNIWSSIIVMIVSVRKHQSSIIVLRQIPNLFLLLSYSSTSTICKSSRPCPA